MNGMWSKSSKQFADRIERKVLGLGLGIGASLLSGGGTSSSRSKRSSRMPAAYYYAESFTNNYSTSDISTGSKPAAIFFLILAPIIHVLGFLSYYLWEWWPFFSLLIFSTLALICIGLAGTFSDGIVDSSKRNFNRLLIATSVEVILFIVFNFWPLYVGDPKISELAYILMVFQLFFTIGSIYSFWNENKVRWQDSEKKLAVESQPSAPKSNTPISEKEYEAVDDGITSSDCVIRDAGSVYGRIWYYIHLTDYPELECVVDCYRMNGDFGEDYQAKEMFKRIKNGEEIGAQIDGYSIFVHPSSATKRNRDVQIDKSLLPYINKMADYFLKYKIKGKPTDFYFMRAKGSYFPTEKA